MNDDERQSVCDSIERLAGQKPSVQYLGVDRWHACAGPRWAESWSFDTAMPKLLEALATPTPKVPSRG